MERLPKCGNRQIKSGKCQIMNKITRIESGRSIRVWQSRPKCRDVLKNGKCPKENILKKLSA